MTAQMADAICLLVVALLPIPLIISWNWGGVALGTLVFWGSIVIEGFYLSYLDPRREGGIGDLMAMMFGWCPGLIYCTAILLTKCAILGHDPITTAKPRPK